MRLEGRREPLRQVDDAAAPALRGGLDAVPVRPADMDPGANQVDIAPSERDHLAPAEHITHKLIEQGAPVNPV
ncbi:hypothetical protein WME91_53265 [Sorangium sp. So ce269]